MPRLFFVPVTGFPPFFVLSWDMRLTSDLPLLDSPTPAVHKAKPRKRRITRVATDAAASAIGAIEPGCEIFALTNGQFSLVDILYHVLDTTGPANLDIATWTASDGDLRRAHAFLLDGRVKRLRFIVDPSFKARKPDFCNTLVELFGSGSIRTTPLHGKFAVIRNDRWNVAVRSSMNLNVNRRIESVEISDDPDLAGFLSDFTEEVFQRSADANFTSQSESLNATHDRESRLAF